MHWIWRIAPLSIFIGLAIGLVCWRWPANPAAKAPSGSGVVASQPADQPLAEKKDSPAPEARIEAATAPAAARRGVVDVEWVGPAVPQLGQPMDYTVQVRNNSNAPVQKVTLNVRLVPGLEIKAARPPAAATEGDVLVWQFDSLLPRQVIPLNLNLVVQAKGDLHPRAWVTFLSSSSSTLHLQAREPKITVKVTPPEKFILGDTATFLLTVANPGDGPAEDVQVHAALSNGLEHARGKTIDFELGNLEAGEQRNVELVCTAKGGGEQKCAILAEARGGIKAQDQSFVKILMPRLQLQVSGPVLRYVQRPATYTLDVKNQGDVTAYNVTLNEVVPAGFKFLSATDGGQLDSGTQTVAWFVGELGPGQTRKVQSEVVPLKAGEYQHQMRASTERGVKLEVDQAVTTRVEDLSALQMDIADTDDPIEVGKETTYEIVINNAGSKIESDLRLSCVIPEEMEFKTALGSRFQAAGNLVVFEPVPRLAPHSDLIYKLKVRARAPGNAQLKAQLTAAGLSEPVLRLEPTRIYSDKP